MKRFEESMNNRDRFRDIMNFKTVDRLPVMELAIWWNKTIERWEKEGLPKRLKPVEIQKYFGLDINKRARFRTTAETYPAPRHGQGIVTDISSYEKIREHLYPKNIVKSNMDLLQDMKESQLSGYAVTHIIINGFFWHPRMLFGIENHFYAFFDHPEVIHRINEDLLKYNIRLIDECCRIFVPDYILIAEDMSYNHGPMLSKALFYEFILPYYQKLVQSIKKYKTNVFVDSDGNIHEMIPWLTDAGIEGAFPLERQSGVDVVEIRKEYPGFKLMGAFDKMVMDRGEESMRNEFERLLPVMRKGGFVLSCDHQTPPQVSMEEYKLYVSLMKEYSIKAAE